MFFVINVDIITELLKSASYRAHLDISISCQLIYDMSVRPDPALNRVLDIRKYDFFRQNKQLHRHATCNNWVAVDKVMLFCSRSARRTASVALRLHLAIRAGVCQFNFKDHDAFVVGVRSTMR